MVTPPKVFFERVYPPMPKSKSTYTEAKKAEYDGNIELAMDLYLKALQENDKAESAIKDYAGLLHMKSQTKAAIDFMETQSKEREVSQGFRNLLTQLKGTHERESSSDFQHLHKTVLVSVDAALDTMIQYETIRAMLPNFLKISKITFVNPVLNGNGFPLSRQAVIEFSSHSAARKAVTVTKHDAITCCWAPSDLVKSAIEKGPVQLVKGGPQVAIRFSIVPTKVVDNEWPLLLLGSGDRPLPDTVVNEDESHNESIGSSSSSQSSPVVLPIPERRRTRSIEVDTAVNEDGECTDLLSEVSMDWCLDTPSPIRHLACCW